MSNTSHEDGFRKVSHKSRNGRKKNPVGHGGHRTKRPTPYESDRATDRRRRINDLRATDLEDLDDYDLLFEPSGYEEDE